MPECPRLWTNLSDEEFAMDIGFTKTEKQFSTFAYPLTNVGNMPRLEKRNYIFGYIVFFVIEYSDARHDALC